ncbi:hypothetical protein RYX36_032653 [Vicia faba]
MRELVQIVSSVGCCYMLRHDGGVIGVVVRFRRRLMRRVGGDVDGSQIQAWATVRELIFFSSLFRYKTFPLYLFLFVIRCVHDFASDTAEKRGSTMMLCTVGHESVLSHGGCQSFATYLFFFDLLTFLQKLSLYSLFLSVNFW